MGAPDPRPVSPEHAAAIEDELTRLILGGRGPQRPELLFGIAAVGVRMQAVGRVLLRFGVNVAQAAEALGRMAAAFDVYYGRSDQ